MTADRVRYVERQPLGAADLTAEQEFRIGQRRRHEQAAHGTPAELTGASVDTPGRTARLGLGSDFVVSVGDAERIRVTPERAVLTGDTRVGGTLRIGKRLAFPDAAPVPAGPSPWRIYRTEGRLRLEINHPGTAGDPALHTFGAGGALTVGSDGTTRIRGNLTVEGGRVEGPVQPDISDPRLGAVLLQSWSIANSSAGRALDERYNNALSVSVGPDEIPPPTPGAALTVRVQNDGRDPLTDVIMAGEVRITNAANTVSTHAISGQFGALAKDQTKDTDRNIGLIPGAYTVTVTVLARATGPEQAVVNGFTTSTWQIVVGGIP
ncbi:hypothetical protein AB0M02_32830 [Actinoplanes sp. NPDC051861]|uniref:hypothetical protein n=1 Tax=Actinoplanes sp. NPDC051861 TaxID=3155170 RepID=UPI00343AE8A1